MILHEIRRKEGILVITPKGSLQANDFEVVRNSVDDYLEDHAALQGILIDAENFSGWADFDALKSHISFVREHHRKVRRIAAVTDNRFMQILPSLLEHFVAAEIRHFDSDERDAAWVWLRG